MQIASVGSQAGTVVHRKDESALPAATGEQQQQQPPQEEQGAASLFDRADADLEGEDLLSDVDCDDAAAASGRRPARTAQRAPSAAQAKPAKARPAAQRKPRPSSKKPTKAHAYPALLLLVF